MYYVFVDDAQQKNPTRPGLELEHLVAMGGVAVPDDAVVNLGNQIEGTCGRYGLSASDEFKWSPGKNDPFRGVVANRTQFYIDILSLAKQSEIKALVVISNERSTPVVNYLPDHQFATFAALLERINSLDSPSTVIADQPGGVYKEFLDNSKDLIEQGTPFQDMNNIPFNVVTTPSRYNRLLQLADVVTSCTLSYVSGENTYSPPVFRHIIPIVRRHNNRYGGVGIKIHPDFLYVNLYHWLLGDEHYNRFGSGHPLPIRSRPYSDSSTQY